MTPSSSERPGLAARVLGALGAGVLRVVLAIAGVLFLASALVAGLIATAGVGVWALLTGRRPTVVRIVRRGWGVRGGPGGAALQRRQDAGDVVDIEAREVSEVHEVQQVHRIGPHRD